MTSICFKLTDFGASRELQMGEEFMSYYGTEEYLVSVPFLYVYNSNMCVSSIPKCMKEL